MSSPLPNVGHVPPHAAELEAAIIGAMMLEAPALRTAFGILTTEQAFYSPAHQFIFRVMRELFQLGQAVDQLTVVAKLRALSLLERCGGAYYVATLTTKINSSAHLESHCRLVQEFHARRQIIITGARLQQHGYDDSQDALELITEAQVQLIALHAGMEARPMQSAADLYDVAFRKLRTAMQQTGLTGVPTGLRELNYATGGWQPADLVIMAARPGMGKTAAMLHFARVAALDHDQAAAIFSLEMPAVQLIERMIASETDAYTNSQLRRGDVPDEAAFNRLYQDALRLKSDKLHIDDTPGLSIHQLRAKAARLKAEKNIKFILVDYIQLMKGDAQRGSNREQEVGSITRGLKELAKELNVPVLALSQLSRDVEKRGGEKRPQLSDLRESGSLEQDADMVVFLWRGEYYDINEYEDGTPTADTLLFDIAKHRNGALGEIIAGCRISKGRFFDPDGPADFGTVQVGPVQVGPMKLGTLPASQFGKGDDNDTPF